MDEAEPSIRDHLERLLPPGGRARQLLGWGVVAWSAIGAILVIGALVRLVERFASIFPYLAVAAMVVFVLNPAVKALVDSPLHSSKLAWVLSRHWFCVLAKA